MSTSERNVLKEMIQALNEEVDAIRQKGRSVSTELHDGEFCGQAAGFWLYRFIWPNDRGLDENTPIQVVVDNSRVKGEVVSFRDQTLVVALDRDLGPKIQVAWLIADNTFLIERLRERLQRVEQGLEDQFNSSAAEKVLGLIPPRVGEEEPDSCVLRDKDSNRPSSLNSEQLLAIRRSLGSETIFVWGPPGTGKTSVVARIVEAHYRKGRSVLLLSNTNVAVDVALEKVAERLQSEPGFDQGLVLRKGPIVKEELRAKFGAQVIPSEVVARLSQALVNERHRLLNEQQRLKDEERALAQAREDLEKVNVIQNALRERQETVAKPKKSVAALCKEAQGHRELASRLREDLNRAQSMGWIRRLILGLNPERLRRQISAAEEAAKAAENTARQHQDELSKLEQEIVQLSSEMKILSRRVQSYLPLEEVRRKLAQLPTELRQIEDRIAEIDRRIAQLEDEVFAKAKIVATTAYRALLDGKTSRPFEVVVVDEASMIIPPLAYYVAGLARSHVTIVGDFMQLPPIALSDTQLVRLWLKRDVFELAGLSTDTKQLSTAKSFERLVQLRTQYRMRESICSVINDLFYGGSLRTDKSLEGVGVKLPLTNNSLVYIDTSVLKPWASRGARGSPYNLLHALLILELILRLRSELQIGETGLSDYLAVVTPYALQARMIQELLTHYLGKSAMGLCSTVHRFQGNEKQFIIFDLTASFGLERIRLFEAGKPTDEDARLLNVAISRAKDQVILVGNFLYFDDRAPKESLVMKLVERFRQDGHKLSADEFLRSKPGFSSSAPVDSASFDIAHGGADVIDVFDENSFYEAFSEDLRNVRQSVIIFSPFATPNGVVRWGDHFNALLSRDVKVRVKVRPPEEQAGNSSAEQQKNSLKLLERMGVEVEPYPEMHQKVAILDDVLWIGSLNIFSHRKTHEIMLRIKAPSVLQKIMQMSSLLNPAREQSLGQPHERY